MAKKNAKKLYPIDFIERVREDGLTVKLRAHGGGDADHWRWDMGDGALLTAGKEVEHEYPSGGYYIVTVSAGLQGDDGWIKWRTFTTSIHAVDEAEAARMEIETARLQALREERDALERASREAAQAELAGFWLAARAGEALSVACMLQARADAGWLWVIPATEYFDRMLGDAERLYRRAPTLDGGTDTYVRVFADGRQEWKRDIPGWAWQLSDHDVNATREVAIGDGEHFGYWGDETTIVRVYDLVAHRVLLDDRNRDYWPETEGETTMEIVNLCPHAVDLVNAAGEVEKFPSAGEARRPIVRHPAQSIAGFEVEEVEMLDEVTGLPDPRPGTIYIVSREIVKHLPSRTDIFAPGELIRDPNGKVIGARGLACTPNYRNGGK